MATKAAKKAGKPASKAKQAKKHAAAKPAPAKAAQAKKVAAKMKSAAKPATAKSAIKAQPVVVKGKVDTKTLAKAAANLAAAKKLSVLQPQAKANAKVQPGKKPGEGETPGDADSPLLDMSDVGVRKMITRAKQRGYVTYDELNKVLPSDKVSSEQIEDTMSMLNEMGINVIESEEQEEQAEGEVPALTGGKQVAVKEGAEEQYDRTDDPVRMYLREMGSVELLSREGEIAIAKRIEAGRELMIGALCESPLTFEALTVWRDELMEGKVLLRDIIDLEAMYGAGPEGQAAAAVAAANSAAAAAALAGGAGAAGLNGAVNGHAVPAPAPKPVPPPAAPKPPRAEGEEVDPAEAAAVADSAADGDDFDDEGNLPLSAMEAALKPQVLETLDQIASLYKKLGKLQDASVEAALAADELSNSQERRFKKLRNETVDLVKGLKLNNNRIEALVDQMYGINRRLVSLEGRLLRLAEAHGVAREDFLREHFGNELDPNWSRRVGRLSRLGWKDFVADERDKIHGLRDEIQTVAQEMRQSISEYRRIVNTVQKGEREFGPGQEGNDRGQPSPRDLHRQEIYQSRLAVPGPHPGRQYRPDEGGR